MVSDATFMTWPPVLCPSDHHDTAGAFETSGAALAPGAPRGVSGTRTERHGGRCRDLPHGSGRRALEQVRTEVSRSTRRADPGHRTLRLGKRLPRWHLSVS